MERIMIFIDGNNFYHGLIENFGKASLDFEPFLRWLTDGRRLVRTYYYNVAAPTSADPAKARRQQQFFDSLRKLPYFEVRLGRLEPRGATFVEKGVDIAIAVDMLSMAFGNVYDTAILVSSDGDFAKAIKAVCDLGKHVEAVCFPKSYHVRTAADKFIVLRGNVLDAFWKSP